MENKEGKMQEINVGDKVKATHRQSGDMRIGVVTEAGTGLLQTRSMTINLVTNDIEVLERALPELPTGESALVGRGPTSKSYIHETGVWYAIEGSNMRRVDDHEVKTKIRDNSYRVVFEGFGA